MFSFLAKNNRGFSMPEILIVVLSISIMVVLALPQLNSTLELNRIQTGSSLVSNKLAEARMLAVKQNRQVSFFLDETNRKVWVEVNSAVVGSVENLPTDIKIKISPDTTATKELVTFNSMGALATATTTISTYYESKRLEVPISVSMSGKITVGTMRSY
jgi:Tfp pilus assembly protein FimT